MYGRTNGRQDMFAVGSRDSGRPATQASESQSGNSRARNSRPMSATAGGAGDRDSLRSADGVGGTSRSDPGGGSRYNAGAVCIDEKVLKQISDNQTKFMQERITKVEHNFGDLCDGFAKYARGIAKLRDRGDIIAKSIITYAGQEALNPRTQEAMHVFGESLAGIQDYRETQVRRIEDKVVKPLTGYGTACKQAKERLKVACTARKKELDQKKELEKSRDRNPLDRQRITKGQTDLQKASVGASKAADEVEQEMETFEEKKLQDIKTIVKDFVTIEMLFHAKALEIYSGIFQQLDSLQEIDDLEYFRNSLRPISAQSRISSQRALQPGNTGTGTGPAGARLGATLLSTTGSDWSSSVDSRPPRGGASKSNRNQSGQRNNQFQRQQAPAANNSRQLPRNTTYNEDDDQDDEDDDEQEGNDDDDDDDDDEDDDDEDDDDMDDDDQETEASSAPNGSVQMRKKQPATGK